MTITLRDAIPTDATAMAAVQNALADAGKRASRVTIEQIKERYLDESPLRIKCTVAVNNEGRVIGFQSLIKAGPDNPYDTPAGWGIIGTHIAPDGGRQGLGRRLFTESRQTAKAAGLEWIEAAIGITNVEGQAYYEAMGFRTWRITADTCCKRWRVS